MNQSVAQQELPAESIAFPKTFANEETLHRLLARLRSEERLKWIEPEGYAPFWLVSHHADILAIEKDAKRFINAPRQALMSFEQEEMGRQLTGGVDPSKMMRNVAAMDGEEHRKYREIAQTYFTPKGLAEVVKGIEGLSAEFVNRMVTAGGECDFAEIAMSYPLRVIMQMLGVSPEDEPMMLSLSQQTLTSQDPDFQQEGGPTAAIMRMVQYFSQTVADRRANPSSDLASVIANARIDGEYLPDPDIFGYFFVVATAGHDTTSYAMTGGLLALINHPAEMQKLRENPALLPNAVEEILRWTTPVKHFCRTATEDCEYAGKQIRKGDIILLSYPSANRDDEAFEDPAEFRIDRRPNRQLAFGTGPHVCLGQYLARFELISFFKELLNRVDDIELAGQPKFVEGTFVSGPKYLPIRYKTR